MPLKYRSRLTLPAALVWLLLIFSWPAAGAAASPSPAGEKRGTLLAAMHRIDDMRLAMSGKRNRALQAQNFVRKRQAILADEIRRRLQTLNVDAFDSAIKDDRIRFDLRLFAQLQAYSDVLAERIAFFELGDDRLAFYSDQAEDDSKMIHVLSDLGVGELMAHIADAMANCRQAMDAPLMDAARILIPSMAQIWPQFAPPQLP